MEKMMKDMTLVETKFLKDEEIPEEFRNLKRDDDYMKNQEERKFTHHVP